MRTCRRYSTPWDLITAVYIPNLFIEICYCLGGRSVVCISHHYPDSNLSTENLLKYNQEPLNTSLIPNDTLVGRLDADQFGNDDTSTELLRIELDPFIGKTENLAATIIHPDGSEESLFSHNYQIEVIDIPSDLRKRTTRFDLPYFEGRPNTNRLHQKLLDATNMNDLLQQLYINTASSFKECCLAEVTSATLESSTY